MKLSYNDRQIEAVLDRNQDGSKFIAKAYWLDGDMLDLTDDELDKAQEALDDQINSNWRGE